MLMTRSKPLALGVTAALVMGASGVSAQARVASVSDASSTSNGLRSQGGGGPGSAAEAALAARLGVSVADLKAAVRVVRAGDTKPDRTTIEAERAAPAEVREAAHEARAARFAKKIAVELGLSEQTVAMAVEAARTAPPARAAKVGTSQGG